MHTTTKTITTQQMMLHACPPALRQEVWALARRYEEGLASSKTTTTTATTAAMGAVSRGAQAAAAAPNTVPTASIVQQQQQQQGPTQAHMQQTTYPKQQQQQQQQGSVVSADMANGTSQPQDPRKGADERNTVHIKEHGLQAGEVQLQGDVGVQMAEAEGGGDQQQCSSTGSGGNGDGHGQGGLHTNTDVGITTKVPAAASNPGQLVVDVAVVAGGAQHTPAAHMSTAPSSEGTAGTASTHHIRVTCALWLIVCCLQHPILKLLSSFSCHLYASSRAMLVFCVSYLVCFTFVPHSLCTFWRFFVSAHTRTHARYARTKLV